MPFKHTSIKKVNHGNLLHTLVREKEIEGETEEVEIEVVIDFTYESAERGSRERKTGLQLEPDWPENIEINFVKDENENMIAITEKETNVIIEKCFEHIRDLKTQSKIDFYDSRND